MLPLGLYAQSPKADFSITFNDDCNRTEITVHNQSTNADSVTLETPDKLITFTDTYTFDSYKDNDLICIAYGKDGNDTLKKFIYLTEIERFSRGPYNHYLSDLYTNIVDFTISYTTVNNTPYSYSTSSKHYSNRYDEQDYLEGRITLEEFEELNAEGEEYNKILDNPLQMYAPATIQLSGEEYRNAYWETGNGDILTGSQAEYTYAEVGTYELKYIDECTQEFVSKEIEILDPSQKVNSTNTVPAIIIYPTITDGFIFIEQSQTDKEFSYIITDNKGVLVQSGTVIDGSIELNKQLFKNGIYNLKLQNNNKATINHRIIMQ